MEQIKQLPLPTPTFNVGKYEIVGPDPEGKRSYYETPEILEDEMTIEAYEAGIKQQYDAIGECLQKIANLIPQRDKKQAWRDENPLPVEEEPEAIEE